MIEKNIKGDISLCVCPECKNNIDLRSYPNIVGGMIIECNHCGMTLLIKEVSGNSVKLEIVDEGK
jgi:DNA-directed RNA polymerase subunit RPC12/RpoP